MTIAVCEHCQSYIATKVWQCTVCNAECETCMECANELIDDRDLVIGSLILVVCAPCSIATRN